MYAIALQKDTKYSTRQLPRRGYQPRVRPGGLLVVNIADAEHRCHRETAAIGKKGKEGCKSYSLSVVVVS